MYFVGGADDERSSLSGVTPPSSQPQKSVRIQHSTKSQPSRKPRLFSAPLVIVRARRLSENTAYHTPVNETWTQEGDVDNRPKSSQCLLRVGIEDDMHNTQEWHRPATSPIVNTKSNQTYEEVNAQPMFFRCHMYPFEPSVAHLCNRPSHPPFTAKRTPPRQRQRQRTRRSQAWQPRWC